MKPILYRVIFAEVALVLLVASTPMPLSFYPFVRGTVAFGGIFLAVRAFSKKKLTLGLAGVASTVLFAAIFDFEFPKSTWIPIDLTFAVIFGLASIALGKPFPLKANEGDLEVLEENDVNTAAAIFIVSFSLLFLYAVSQGGAATGCENWIQDPRGGYCDG